jgi:hypothetical protein
MRGGQELGINGQIEEAISMGSHDGRDNEPALLRAWEGEDIGC